MSLQLPKVLCCKRKDKGYDLTVYKCSILQGSKPNLNRTAVLLNCTALAILACTKALPSTYQPHFATSSRRRKRDSKIRGLNNTSSLTMALLTSDAGVTGQGFYIRAHLEMIFSHHGDFFLRGSVLTTNEHRHFHFTSAALSDDWWRNFCWLWREKKTHLVAQQMFLALKARWMDTRHNTKQCSENMKRCMETILDVRNGFEIHHAVKVVSWSHHVLIFWSYPSFRFWIFPILLFKNHPFPYTLQNLSKKPEKLHSPGWCDPSWPKVWMTPTGFGVFSSSQSCGLLRRRLFLGFGPHVEHKSSAEAYYDNVNRGAPFLHANAVSRRKENRSSPKTPAKSWFLENSLGPLAKVIPQSKSRSAFWRNEGEQSLEITTGQVGKVTDRRAASSKTLLSFSDVFGFPIRLCSPVTCLWNWFFNKSLLSFKEHSQSGWCKGRQHLHHLLIPPGPYIMTKSKRSTGLFISLSRSVNSIDGSQHGFAIAVKGHSCTSDLFFSFIWLHIFLHQTRLTFFGPLVLFNVGLFYTKHKKKIISLWIYRVGLLYTPFCSY